MLLKDVRLTLANIVSDSSKETVQVVSARPDTDKDSVIIGYKLEIATRRCSKNPVKLPKSDENKAAVEALDKLLKKQDYVEVKLKEPVIRLYAMLSNGNLISGVSIKADGFEIVDSDDDLLG